MIESMGDGLLQATMQRKTSYCIGIVVDVVTRAWTALPRSIERGGFLATYLVYFLHERNMAVLQARESRVDSF